MKRHQGSCTGSKPVARARGSGLKRNQRNVATTPTPSSFKIVKSSTAFSNASVTWKLKYNQNDGSNYIRLLDASTIAMEGHLRRYQRNQQACKFNMSLHVVFEKASDPSIVTTPPVVLVTEPFEVYTSTNINEVLKTCSLQLQNRIEIYEANGSGWVVSKLVALDTTLWQLDPLRVSTYHPLPTWIQ